MAGHTDRQTYRHRLREEQTMTVHDEKLAFLAGHTEDRQIYGVTEAYEE